MKKEILKNDEIFAIGNKVLNAIRLPDEEIEEIVTASHLFDRIRVEMEAKPFVLEARDHSFGASGLFRSKWKIAFAALGLFVVVAAGAVGLIRVAERYQPSEVAFDYQDGQMFPVDIPRLTPTISDHPTSRVSDAEPRRFIREKQATKPRLVERPARLENKEEMGEFQTITYTDDTDEASLEGRIVRVDLPRASLYAMGIDLPVDSGTGKIKTDLLVGFDGVMKAVRIVKMD